MVWESSRGSSHQTSSAFVRSSVTKGTASFRLGFVYCL